MEKNLLSFLTIARLGNITASAEQLRVAQPSLTKRLRLLEEKYQVVLFERHPRGMTLTRAGKRLYEYASKIEYTYLQAREAVEATKNESLEVLSIGAGPLFMRADFASVIESLRQEFPETNIHVRADVHTRNVPLLKLGELDVVLGALVVDMMDDSILFEPLSKVQLGALARQDHKILKRELITAADLSQVPWMLYSDDDSTATMVRGYFLRNGVRPPDFSIQTTSYEFALKLLASSEYLMPAPIQLNALFEPLGLKALPLQEEIDHFQTGAYVRKSLSSFSIVKRLLEYVKAL